MAKTYKSVNDFTGEVTKILKAYADEVNDITTEAVMKTAFEAEEQLHVAGDFKNGAKSKYRKGWTVTFEQHRLYIEAIVHNKDYQLTHLLESGHAKWLWGRATNEDVRAFPHIEKVNEEAQRMLQEYIERGLG